MRLQALLGLLLAQTSCHAWLVGGECLPGYAQEDDRCVATDAPAGGRGGAEAVGAGGPDGGAPAGAGGAGAGGALAQGGATAQGGAGGDATGGAGGGIDCGPLTSCGADCVDTDSDPDHCGACGHACQTGLCGGGQCQGAFAGHVAAIGIDYGVVTPSSSAARLLGNAVFLHPAEPVKVALYTEYATQQVNAQVPALLAAEAAARGRNLQLSTVATDAQLADLATTLGVDVIVIPPSPMAPQGTMGAVGASWAGPLFDFAAQGGVVVALADGGSEDLLNATGLLGPLALAAEPVAPCSVASWIDALSTGVLSPFALGHASTHLEPLLPLDPTTQIVVVGPSSAPVVLHRVVVPPL